jgi:AraC family transcriptional activator of pobA
VRFREAFLPHASSILFNHFVGYSSVPAPPEAAADLDALFGLIRREAQNGDRSSRSPLRHLLRALIAKIEGWWLRLVEMQPQALTDSQRRWERFTRLVEEKFQVEHSAGYYAGELGASLRGLNAIKRLFAGVTVAEAIDRRLMLEAKRQLLFSAHSVGEISFALGFAEHSYFTRVFRKRLGMTPMEFRASNRPA